ncbi:MAG: exo-alpha-sialidase [Leptospiraceae bacterium]|nr:exo-alpha-sialidase [Leptospiraceae bacterium]
MTRRIVQGIILASNCLALAHCIRPTDACLSADPDCNLTASILYARQQTRCTYRNSSPGAVDSIDTLSTTGATPGHVAVGTQGTILAAYGLNNGSHNLWTVRRSQDAGATWNTVDSYDPAANNHNAQGVLEFQNQFYVTGNDNVGTSDRWITRRSPDQGSTWSTVDNWQLFASAQATGSVLFADANGLHVAGRAFDSGGQQHLIIRSSSDGATWTTSYDLTMPGGTTLTVNDAIVSSDGTNTAYVTASGQTSPGSWLVFRRQNGSWSLVDTYLLSPAKSAAAAGIILDGQRVLVHGIAEDSSSVFHTNLRTSLDGGTSWSTTDSYSLGFNSTVGGGIYKNPGDGQILLFGGGLTTASQPGPLSLFIRSSFDNGATWNSFHSSPVTTSGSLGTYYLPAIDNQYNLFISGYFVDGGGTTHSTLYRLPPSSCWKELY